MKKHINYILENESLGKALEEVRRILGNGIPRYDDELRAIEEDYRRMQHYMLEGYDDKQRERLYEELLVRLDRLVADYMLDAHTTVPSGLSAPPTHSNLKGDFEEGGAASVRQALEMFAAEIALFDADKTSPLLRKTSSNSHPSKERDSQRDGSAPEDLWREHTAYMDKIFEQLYRTPQWSEEVAHAYEELILSPAIQAADAMLIVSAISLAHMRTFDMQKMSLLVNVYLHADDEHLRQRALVGWALSIHEKLRIYPDIKQILKVVMAQQSVREELLALEMQLYLCMNAEKDQRQLQESIIPGIINNNHLHITPNGISEKEEDVLQNILHPEAEEQAMEEVEENVRRMMQMQEAGTDIYYGGFTQMKNFPFFQKMANWFRPFDINHPDLKGAKEILGKSSALEAFNSQKMMSDSDKYSFAIALSKMIDKIPQNVIEALNGAELAITPSEMASSATLIRRLYLQTLYRFSRLYKDRHQFDSPFKKLEKQHTIYRYQELISLCKDTVPQLGRFLYKQKRYEDLETLLRTYPDNSSEDIENMRAYLHIRNGRYDEAAKLLQGKKKRPAMELLARAYYLKEEYAQAQSVYEQLMTMDESILRHELGYVRCLIKRRDYMQAERTLFKLDYNTPENVQIMQLLAWTLLNNHKPQEAIKVYRNILQQSDTHQENLLNAAYAYWITRQLKKAQRLFKQYVMRMKEKEAYETMRQALNDDSELLDNYQISTIERELMTDIVCGEVEE